MTAEVLVLDALRTPVGRVGGALAWVRPDDLAAHALRALLARHPELDPARIDEVYLGDANGAGEDNRNVARMAVLLAGLPVNVLWSHGQPPVWFGYGGDHPGKPRDRRRRCLGLRGRRGGIDESGALGHAQA